MGKEVTNKLTIENCEAWLAYNPLGSNTLIQRAFEQLADIMRENEQLINFIRKVSDVKDSIGREATALLADFPYKDRDNG